MAGGGSHSSGHVSYLSGMYVAIVLSQNFDAMYTVTGVGHEVGHLCDIIFFDRYRS